MFGLIGEKYFYDNKETKVNVIVVSTTSSKFVVKGSISQRLGNVKHWILNVLYFLF